YKYHALSILRTKYRYLHENEEFWGRGRGSAAMLAAILVGVSPARGTCPVATVAISGDGEGDQCIGSPEVKVPVGRAQMLGQIRQGGKQLDRVRRPKPARCSE